MPRAPRFAVTDFPLHVVQRGHNRRPCFFNDADYRAYLAMLRDLSAHYRVRVHAYALMTNHVHLLATPLVPHSISRMMQALGTRYVRRINNALGRSGTLWEGRYHACLVARDNYVVSACRYIDLNPVRAGLVTDPLSYRWTSYAALVGRREDTFLYPHSALDQLGRVPGHAYAQWCARGIADSELTALREATARELAFGDDQFKVDIAAATFRKMLPVRRSRTPRSVETGEN